MMMMMSDENCGKESLRLLISVVVEVADWWMAMKHEGVMALLVEVNSSSRVYMGSKAVTFDEMAT